MSTGSIIAITAIITTVAWFVMFAVIAVFVIPAILPKLIQRMAMRAAVSAMKARAAVPGDVVNTNTRYALNGDRDATTPDYHDDGKEV